ADLLGLLKLKIEGGDGSVFDFFDYDPEDLSSANTKDNIHCHDDGRVYVFASPESKLRRGIDMDTSSGSWLLISNSVIKNDGGERIAAKSLYCFYADELSCDGALLRKGRRKTPWSMREFRLISGVKKTSGEEIALCVVRKSTR
ncbi:unnamed protein product, partial [Linum tenue]